jgi:hypothetical protein
MSNILKKLGIQPALRNELSVRDKAFSGDIVWVVTPSTVVVVPTEVDWTRTVVVELQTAAGEVHTWFSDEIASGNSIANTGDGTASIVSEILTIVNGRAEVVVSGIEGWDNTNTDTYTVAVATILNTTVSAVTSVETFTTAS